MTDDELALMDVLADVANRFGRIIGRGPTRGHDLAEVVDKIHQLQTVVMAQAAARAYPDQFRLLGGVVGDGCKRVSP